MKLIDRTRQAISEIFFFSIFVSFIRLILASNEIWNVSRLVLVARAHFFSFVLSTRNFFFFYAISFSLSNLMSSYATWNRSQARVLFRLRFVWIWKHTPLRRSHVKTVETFFDEWIEKRSFLFFHRRSNNRILVDRQAHFGSLANALNPIDARKVTTHVKRATKNPTQAQSTFLCVRSLAFRLCFFSVSRSFYFAFIVERLIFLIFLTSQPHSSGRLKSLRLDSIQSQNHSIRNWINASAKSDRRKQQN